MSTVAVIIPFFQRRAGILSEALRSVVRQDFAGQIDVIVINDGSPVAPGADIAAAVDGGLPGNRSISVVHMDNGGPGAARNAGLDRLGPGAGIVAFIDSDDVWEPCHIRRGVKSIQAGADVYFADYRRQSEPDSKFRMTDYAPYGEAFTGSAERDVFHLKGDLIADLLAGAHVGTSTFILRRNLIGKRRFPTSYRCAHEDTIFFIGVAEAARTVAVSSWCEVFYGSGVNVYANSGRGEEFSLRRIYDEIRYIRYLKRTYPTSPEVDAYVRDAVPRTRQQFYDDVSVRGTRMFQALSGYAKYVLVDPLVVTFVFSRVMRSIVAKSRIGRSGAG